MEPYWSNEKYGLSIYHGDCLEIMPQLEQQFDLCLTDPPYGVDIALWDIAPTIEFRNLCLSITHGPLIMFGSASMRSFMEFMKLEPDRILIWAPKFTLSHTAANGISFRWHPIWCWQLPTDAREGPSWDILTTPCDGHNWWYHPCTKPLALMEQLCGFAVRDSTIIDPFVGSGTTLVACFRIGRYGVGIEIDEGCCEISAQRLDNEIAQGRLFEPYESAKPEQLTIE